MPAFSCVFSSFVFSGWALADSAPLFDGAGNGTATRYFCLAITFNYTDDTKKQIVASFNPGCENQWQYVSQAAVAAKAYDSITIQASYSFNANSAKFDGIQLFKEEFGTSYTYDEDGNVTSVVDLQKKNTTYEYNGNGDVTKILEDNKAKVTYTYYENSHNVETATTEEGLVYSFEYDAYGNNTKVSIGSGTTTISSSATYTTNGNYVASTTDALDKVTTYSYNEDTGVLDWVKYPEDTEATKTVHSYDSMFRKALEECTTSTGAEMSAQYTYEDDYLTAVTTPTTTYSFTYGDFGLRSNVQIGNRTLVSYTYDEDYYPKQLNYGNGNYIEYKYEDGRKLKENYEDGDTVEYQYDNNGNLARKIDSATGRTTTYYYDLTERMVKYEEKGTGYSHSVSYAYNEKNNLTQLVEITNDITTTTSYTYDDDNRVTSVTVGNITVEYTYDTHGRLTDKITKNGQTAIKSENFYYQSSDEGHPTNQILYHYTTYADGSSDIAYYYYDRNGNITWIEQSDTMPEFQYDSANQLIWMRDFATSKTMTWSYDEAGNLLCAEQYNLVFNEDFGELEESSEPYKRVTYTYDDPWGDLLTKVNNQPITYDQIGNPLNDGEWTYTWEHGRQLKSMSNSATTWSYEYNADGLRTKRTNGTTTYKYTYNGSQLTQMTVGNNTLNFTYDASGTPLTVTLGNTVYYYVTNLQGDVTKIVDGSGNMAANYSYDAWGVCDEIIGEPIGQENPLRYRGYMYDSETRLYYLQSRYYDPELGRFLNADALTSTGQGLLGNNMFAYCGNNAVNNCDPNGMWMVATDILKGGPVGPATLPGVDPSYCPGGNGTLGEDIKDFLFNEDEQAVLSAEHIAFYKGKLIVKTSGTSGFSCGIIFIGNEVNSTSVVRHEYGHTQQLEALGLATYLSTVVLPSTICFHLTQAGVLPHENYYNYPWEHKADQFGDVTRDYAPWSYIVSDIYWQTSRGIAQSLP